MTGEERTRTRTVDASIQAQLNNLGDRIDKGFSELRETIMGYEARIRILENTQAGCQPLMTSRIDAAFRKIDEHTTKIEALTEANQQLKQIITELQHSNKILTWLGGLLGSALLLWLVNQLLVLIK